MDNATCGVPECERARHYRQPYCKTHYSRWKRTGQTGRLLIVRTTCEIDDCGRPHLSRGMCSMHYGRWKNNGDPRVVQKVIGQGECYAPECTRQAVSYGLCDRHYRRMRMYGSTELPQRQRPACWAKGCDTPAVSRGLCNKHYRRVMAHGPEGLTQGDPQTCEQPGCGVKHYARGLCRQHYDDDYRANNRAVFAQRQALRRERVAKGMSQAEIAEALEYRRLIAADPCIYCGGPAGTVDHIDAVATGGTDRWTNLAAACHSCNSSKKTKTPLEFMLWRLAREGAGHGRSARQPSGAV